jgi:DNA-binding NtrC family response regulator
MDVEGFDVGEEECIVLGRKPDVSHLDSALGAPLHRARTHVVLSASVSANHAVAWRCSGGLQVRDLGSRNGTWVRLPSKTTLSLPDGEPVELRLAFPGLSVSVDEQPESPRYRDEADFGAAVAKSVQAWLQRQDVPARVWAAYGGEGPGGTAPLRLANGALLWIQVDRTVDAVFHERMTQVCRYVSAQNALFAAEVATRSEGTVLASPVIRAVHRRVVELAMQSLPSMVLLGPSGTGKERLAQAYHRHLGRRGGLIPINCATLTRERVVADLFGAEAGAYTGAQRTMIGAVEHADGGTLFLDEVGELPLDVQPMLLRFLETGEYYRLGALGRPRTSDVRVVAATNRDLRQMTREGRFREDLFFRLALEIVEVPSLRERRADVEAYLRTQMLGMVSAHDALLPPALQVVQEHSWSGNFRELVNFVRRLPRAAEPASIGAELVIRLLEAGTLAAVRVPSLPPPSQTPAPEWTEWLRASAEAFLAESGQAPQTWTDVTTFVEQYLKPWALASLANLTSLRDLTDVSVSQVAEQVKADRGTVAKQLRRYLECQRPR